MGAVVGIIPFADWALQKFWVNENAVKKVGQIFGMEAKFIDEDNEKEKKLLEKKAMIYYTIPELSDENYNSYIIGNQLTKQETKYKIGKTIECVTHTGEYVSIIPTVNYGIKAAAESVQFSAQAAKFTAQATQFSSQAAKITNEINNAGKLTEFWNYISGTRAIMAKEVANLSSKVSSATISANSAVSAANTSALAGTSGKAFGVAFGVLGVVVGVGCGAYFTHKFCEETLDKYAEYYKMNAEKINNSYIDAAEYFLIK